MVRFHRLPHGFLAIIAVVTALATGSSRARAQCASDEDGRLVASGSFPANRFGRSITVHGDVAVVGCFRDDELGPESGSASVYRRQGGSWVLEQKLVGQDTTAFDWFGYTVATDGKVIAVGAAHEKSTVIHGGTVYMFRFQGGSWVQEDEFLGSVAEVSDGDHMQLAVEGDELVLGAPYHGLDRGLVYEFQWNGLHWVEQARVKPADLVALDYFGWSLALDGDTMLATSPRIEGDDTGKAYIFRKIGGQWVEQQTLFASDKSVGDRFGWSAALRGNLALIGAVYDDGLTGGAYLYHFDGASWRDAGKVTAEDRNPYDQFGYAVALSSSVALIGARGDSDRRQFAGCVYAFRHDGEHLSPARKLTPSDGTWFDYYGTAVATDGDEAFVGNNPNQHAGVVYLHAVPELPLVVEPTLVPPHGFVSFSTCGGLGGAGVLLAVVEVSGVPVFQQLLLGRFDQSGVHHLGSLVPPIPSGLTVVLQSFGIARDGQPAASNRELVIFQ